MKSFRNWHGVHLMTFHNLIEEHFPPQVTPSPWSMPDSPDSRFSSKMHRHVMYLFILELNEQLERMQVKRGLLSILGPRNIANQTDANNNIRDLYGSDFLDIVYNLDKQSRKNGKVYAFSVASIFCSPRSQLPEGYVDDFDDPINFTAEYMIDLRETTIKPYLETMKASGA